MQLDRTRIAIRSRGIWDLLDLSLRVTRIYAKPLTTLTLLAAIPFALLNFYALHWTLTEEFSKYTRSNYLMAMSLLIFLQAPIVTLPATQLLGRAMFRQPIDFGLIFDDIRQVAMRLFWVQGLWRAGGLMVAVALAIRADRDVAGGIGVLVVLSIYGYLVRASRTFINEIVLLERAPVRATKESPTSITRRSRSLHGPSTGDLLLRWSVAAFGTGLLCFNLILVFWFASSILSGSWRFNRLMVELFCPLCMWLVAIYATVFKFLNYLDIRIRHEGWEVELSVKAAAEELREAA